MSLNIQQIRIKLLHEKIRVIFLFVCLILSLISFSKNKKNPPNGIRINDTLFIDETEVTNLDWQEYFYWTKRIYGDSVAKSKCGINEDLWILDTIQVYGGPMKKYYFSHPAYMTYPAIGISYQQAVEYCKWREDRVYEMSLTKNKIIPFPATTDSNHVFIIDGFLNGTYKCEIKNKNKLLEIPIYKYRLPTLEEFKTIEQDGYASYLKSINSNTKIKRYRYSKSIIDSSDITDITSDVHSNYPNKLGIFNLTQNVSEMTNIEGIAYGGNWTMKEIPKDYTAAYSEPTIWLGFRCIAIKTKFTDYNSIYK
ncbi:MAG: SUMF1/EgtB/PvdO family nonheme iron enzyme [Chitinophagales bacterium]